ncbi:MAG TPA: DUF4345 family protein [Rhizomicrobium sp.]|nr:DUF4345 family protein [Rhizomicrobium sp.]
MRIDAMPERRFLQIAVAAAGLVPVAAGALGALRPALLFGGPPHTLTHGAYLSGLLLGLGLAFWSLIPKIEHQRHTFGLLAGLVVLGGLARALTAARLGAWNLSVELPLVMELGVTPALWLWQRRVSSLLRPE